MDVDPQLSVRRIHVRSRAGLLPQLIDNGVFDSLRGELAVRDRGAHERDVDREGLGEVEMIGPGQHACALVEQIGRGRWERGNGQKHATREPRPETHAIGGLEGAGERHTSPHLTHLAGPKLGELTQEERLELPSTGGKERKAVSHGRL